MEVFLKTFCCLMTCLIMNTPGVGQDGSSAAQTPKTETSYDSDKDRTTTRLSPVQIAGEQGKYRRLQISPAFSFPGTKLLSPPPIIDFELQTAIKGRLSTDLYVVFVIDGESVFLSSSRWAIKRPVPGRVWVGERLVFRMPYETFVKITNAKTFALKFDGVVFPVSEPQLQLLRDFLKLTTGSAGVSPATEREARTKAAIN